MTQLTLEVGVVPMQDNGQGYRTTDERIIGKVTRIFQIELCIALQVICTI